MPLDASTISAAIIPIAAVIRRSELYPRQRHDPGTVARYASLTTPAPAICVNQHNELADGWHRCLAASERGETTISAQVVHTRDDQHLLDLAVEMNFAHGLALSQSDKQRLAIMRYEPSAGNLTVQKRDIAEWLRVHYDTVNNWLQARDHAFRQERNARIQELREQGLSQDRIAAEIGCSKGLVNLRVRSEIRETELLTGLPVGFVPELYDEWRLTSNSDGLGHFGATDPRIIDNLLWRYAREPDDVVLDLFAGGGTTFDVCEKWQRNCFAYDRKPRPARNGDIQRHDILVDGLLPALTRDQWTDVSLVFLDPPYAAQAAGQYSNDATDLAHLSLDDFERVLSDLINALGTVLSSGAAIALLIRNTQWHSGPEHRTRRHDRNIENLVSLDFEREIFCPLGRNATPTERTWAELTRDCLVVSRKLLVWRV